MGRTTSTSARTTRRARWSRSSDYRRRHAQYKTDPDLQALHAKYAWIVTWDDHEVTNDQWKRGRGEPRRHRGRLPPRRARAHRAYDEWMPVRMDGTASLGDGARLYRRLRFGDLAEISMLDLRTYRSEQVSTLAPTPGPGGRGRDQRPRRARSPARRQMEWLKDSLTRGNHAPQWKVIGNPVMIAPVTFADLPDELVRPGQRRHRAAAAGRLALQRRPVGRLHRRPSRGASTTSTTTRSRTWSS